LLRGRYAPSCRVGSRVTAREFSQRAAKREDSRLRGLFPAALMPLLRSARVRDQLHSVVEPATFMPTTQVAERDKRSVNAAKSELQLQMAVRVSLL